MELKKECGQYFTSSNDLQQYIFDKVKYKSSLLLEPSFGRGHLLLKFKEFNENYPMVCYELDKNLIPIISFNKYQQIIYDNFITSKIENKFKTIIGNPPYVKQKDGNLYLKFIEKCFDLLDDNGELIFIVPSDFIKLTSASKVINKLITFGSFTDFLFPHNESLFENANIDVVLFRYEKGLYEKKVTVNNTEMYLNVNNNIITFDKTLKTGYNLNSIFNVYVGMISGRDKIYRTSFGNIDMLIDENKIAKYIYPTSFPTGNDKIDKHLETHKQELISRKIRKFTEKNWFEWGAPRNVQAIKKHLNSPCIYVKTLTRNNIIAFEGKVQYFGGTLLCLIPKDNTTDLNLIINYLNSKEFKDNYIYAGRFKIGHRQISSAIIE